MVGKSVLERPWAYNLYQDLLGARSANRVMVESYLRPHDGSRILDIGCGTAEILRFISSGEYVGFDINERYIETARRRFGSRATFRCEAFDEESRAGLAPFDVALFSGLLHHLSDEEALSLLRAVHASLKEDGRLVTIDPVLVDGQSRIARFLITRDRGEHVRTAADYCELVSHLFSDVRVEIRHDMATIPYTNAVIQAAKLS